MKRVLMIWFCGDRLYRYTFVSKIPDDYILPESTDEVYFIEGIIIDGESIESYVIQLIPRGELLTNSHGRIFLSI